MIKIVFLIKHSDGKSDYSKSGLNMSKFFILVLFIEQIREET